MKETWLPTGASDPVSFTCTCPALSKGDGLVLLFYRYFDATPSVPTSHYDLKNDPASLASFHATVTRKLEIGGKIRIAREGFNVTIGGTKFAVEDYMQECISHWSFAGLDLSTQEKQYQFFKPTCGGCACVFGGSPASVRVTSEITPMGVTNYIPAKWDRVESLSPAEFHERCHSNPNTMLVDVRNHYESRIGYFIDPKSGEPALRPALRRFSQWPQCCQSCEEFDKQAPSTELNSGQTERRPVCFCEKEREAELWGATSEKDLKIQGWKKNKRKLQSGTSINIQVMTIQ
ncbi:uncharacterized protein RAG0_09874 [Rhynchosporium agropyri]|uniref:tRNA uridine(34) hydroxylase N-terminal domain-containing protein n=1 Tax=Rhynchosporium agropyri TaxID=914238 RepID=A0A1E1KXD0_9HELO|nr:uncharacterized protein RAG0_09874 [Rhynchosporium agropyri]